jgi:hypothetical protein
VYHSWHAGRTVASVESPWANEKVRLSFVVCYFLGSVGRADAVSIVPGVKICRN